MMPLIGDVLFDSEFIFSDGNTGKKWFVILADVGDDTKNIYVARATSKNKSEKTEGCHDNDGFMPTYFLPAGDTFKKDTWIQFDQVLIFDFDRAQDLQSQSRWKKSKRLSIKTMHKILCCAAKSDHIDGYTEEVLLKQARLFK